MAQSEDNQDYSQLSVDELKLLLANSHVDHSGVSEKSALIQLAQSNLKPPKEAEPPGFSPAKNVFVAQQSPIQASAQSKQTATTFTHSQTSNYSYSGGGGFWIQPLKPEVRETWLCNVTVYSRIIQAWILPKPYALNAAGTAVVCSAYAVVINIF